MKSEGIEALALINQTVENTNSTDFMIRDYVDGILRIVGSFDLCYYHEIEIRIKEPSYISLPTYFDHPHFRLAHENEKEKLTNQCEIESMVICIEEDPKFTKRKHFIVTESIEAEQCMVYHYERENLKVGERIELPSKLNSNQSLMDNA